MTTRSFVSAVILVSGIHGTAFSQGTAADPLVAGLRSTNQKDKDRAISELLRRKPAERSAALLDAVMKEVLDQRAMLDARGRRYAAGELLQPLEEDDYLPRLLTALGQSNDPRVIQPLCLFIASGTLVEHPLARFGRQALPRVLSIARDRSARPDVVESALRTLAEMLEPKTNANLSRDEQLQIREVGRYWLTQRSEDGAVNRVTGAAALAIALGDEELIGRVGFLSRDIPAVRALGIETEFRIALLQRLLTQTLASRKGP